MLAWFWVAAVLLLAGPEAEANPDDDGFTVAVALVVLGILILTRASGPSRRP
jgi:hypothetical protein